MKITALAIARALVEVAKTLPESEAPALADAAADLLITNGLWKDSRTFPALVLSVWQKAEGIVPVRITTVNGDAGSLKGDVVDAVQSVLKRRCTVEERADSSILGGVLLTVGDERYDATLRGSLSAVSERLSASIPVAD